MNFVLNQFRKIRSIYNDSNPFAIEEKLMKTLGFWPKDVIVRWKVFGIFLIELLFVTLPGLKFLFDSVVNQNRQAFALVVPEVLINCLTIWCLGDFIRNFKLIQIFLNMLDGESKSGNKFTEWTEVQEKTGRICNRISILSVFSMHLTGLFYFFIPSCLFFIKCYYLHTTTVDDWKIFLVDFGLDWKHSWLFIPYQILLLLFYLIKTSTSMIPVLFYMKSINSCATHFKLVKILIRDLEKSLLKAQRGRNIGRELKMKLKAVVQQHVKALELSKMVREITNNFMLVYLLSVSAVICFLSFNLTIVFNDKLVLMKIGALCFVMKVNLFLFSYFGTKLMEESFSIATEVADLSWLNSKSLSMRKDLALIILRAQQSTGIKAGKFCFITFNTYAGVLNTIVSYFSVLQALLLDKN